MSCPCGIPGCTLGAAFVAPGYGFASMMFPPPPHQRSGKVKSTGKKGRPTAPSSGPLQQQNPYGDPYAQQPGYPPGYPQPDPYAQQLQQQAYAQQLQQQYAQQAYAQQAYAQQAQLLAQQQGPQGPDPFGGPWDPYEGMQQAMSGDDDGGGG